MLACTLLTGMYLSHARALAESFFEHNRGCEFVALLVDGSDPQPLQARGCRVLTPADIGLDAAETARRAIAYRPQEFVVSMKAALLRKLLAEDGDAVLLMDADTFVVATLEPLFELARREQVVLTGHWTTARPWPDPTGAELAVLRGGAINSGVVGVGAGAEEMLDWWGARLTRDCVLDYDRGLFLDQLWLSEVPTTFPCTVLRDAGVNASLLSLFDGDVEWREKMPYLHGAPVRLWHFLGAFDPHAPEALAGEPWLRQFIPYAGSRPGAHRLARGYAQRLLANEYDAVARRDYAYAELPAGLVLEPAMRVLYREALIEAELSGRAEPPNPLLVGTEPFLDWLASPAAGDTVPRYLLGHYRLRADVRTEFPAVPGEDSERFLGWASGAVLRGEIAPPSGLLQRLPFLARR